MTHRATLTTRTQPAPQPSGRDALAMQVHDLQTPLMIVAASARALRPSDGRAVLDDERDAEIDQSRRCAHDRVRGLDVEVDDLLGAQVVDRGGELERHRDELFRWQRAITAHECGQPRSLEVLQHEMRPGPVDHGVDPTS